MARRSLALLLFVCGCSSPPPSEEAQLQSVKAQAEEIVKALAADDYATVAKFSHPKIIELAGDRDKLTAVVKKELDQMKAQGITWHSMNVEAPAEVIKDGAKRYAIVPQTVVVVMPQGKATSQGYLLGVSSDQGRNWTFLDGAKLDEAKLKRFIPDAPAALKLPPKRPPVIERTEPSGSKP